MARNLKLSGYSPDRDEQYFTCWKNFRPYTFNQGDDPGCIRRRHTMVIACLFCILLTGILFFFQWKITAHSVGKGFRKNMRLHFPRFRQHEWNIRAANDRQAEDCVRSYTIHPYYKSIYCKIQFPEKNFHRTGHRLPPILSWKVQIPPIQLHSGRNNHFRQFPELLQPHKIWSCGTVNILDSSFLFLYRNKSCLISIKDQ